MNDPKDMEALAALEHESWSGWTKWMLGQMEKERSGDIAERDRHDYDISQEAFIDGLPCVKRWRRQMATAYADLSEREKESDRKEVREKVKIYRGATQIFRSSVEILVWNEDRTRLLTVTNRRWGGFSCPGGKVDPGETLITAARRELTEETGCYPDSIREFAAGVHYDDPQDGGPPWFCMSFIAEGCNAPTQQEEGTEIGWHSPKELVDASIYPDWYRFLFKLMPEVTSV